MANRNGSQGYGARLSLDHYPNRRNCNSMLPYLVRPSPVFERSSILGIDTDLQYGFRQETWSGRLLWKLCRYVLDSRHSNQEPRPDAWARYFSIL